MNKAAALFQGWPETMVWSCLQGCMGQVLVEGGEEPASAAALIGDFCLFRRPPGQGACPESGSVYPGPRRPGMGLSAGGGLGGEDYTLDPVRHGEGSKLLLPGQAGGLCRSADGI